jgi:ectoine hydroxylase-related dioxygenase (phytanoyl-CoA dioxygenase family)
MTYSPYLDSTEIIDDGDALSARLKDEGYLFIRGLIPREEVLMVRARLMRIGAEYDWFDKNSPVIDGVVNPDFDSKKFRSTTMSAINRMWCDEHLHRLRSHVNILSLYDRIFKEPALAHPKFTLRQFFPNAPPTISHQDHVHVGGNEFCSMWVPLGDCPVELGVLAIASKSHRDGIFKSQFAGMGVTDDPSWSWVAGPVMAGDVLIFSNTTVHKSLPNLTNHLRLSFDGRYQAASLPISTLSLTPTGDSGCDDWESVYKQWSSNADQYYWKKINLNVVHFDTTHYEVDYPAAFTLAKGGDKAMRDDLLRLI